MVFVRNTQKCLLNRSPPSSHDIILFFYLKGRDLVVRFAKLSPPLYHYSPFSLLLIFLLHNGRPNVRETSSSMIWISFPRGSLKEQLLQSKIWTSQCVRFIGVSPKCRSSNCPNSISRTFFRWAKFSSCIAYVKDCVVILMLMLGYWGACTFGWDEKSLSLQLLGLSCVSSSSSNLCRNSLGLTLLRFFACCYVFGIFLVEVFSCWFSTVFLFFTATCFLVHQVSNITQQLALDHNVFLTQLCKCLTQWVVLVT